MYVCVCKAVNEKRIYKAVDQGVTRLQELSAQTGLGTCCGKCVPDARKELAQALRQHRPHPFRHEQAQLAA